MFWLNFQKNSLSCLGVNVCCWNGGWDTVVRHHLKLFINHKWVYGQFWHSFDVWCLQSAYLNLFSEWKNYVRDAAKNWMELNRDWLKFSGPLYVVHYEDFKSEPANQLSRLLKFLNIEISNNNMLCVMKNIEGYFKRTKMRTVRNNPYTKFIRNDILHFKRQLKIQLDIYDTKRKLNDRQ